MKKEGKLKNVPLDISIESPTFRDLKFLAEDIEYYIKSKGDTPSAIFPGNSYYTWMILRSLMESKKLDEPIFGKKYL